MDARAVEVTSGVVTGEVWIRVASEASSEAFCRASLRAVVGEALV
jgi:hypothetical protein